MSSGCSSQAEPTPAASARAVSRPPGGGAAGALARGGPAARLPQCVACLSGRLALGAESRRVLCALAEDLSGVHVGVLCVPRPYSSRPSSRGPVTPAPSTGPPGGSMSEPPRGGGAMIWTGTTTNPERTSGCGRSEETGDEPSIAKIANLHGTTESLRSLKHPLDGGVVRNAG